MAEDEKSPAPKENKSPKKPEWKNILPTLLFLLILVVIAAVSFWFGTKRKQAEPSVTPSPTTQATTSPSPSPSSLPEPSPTPRDSSMPDVISTPSPTNTPTPEPVLKTKTINSNASLDGFQASNGGGNKGVEVRAGRNKYLITRGFLSFDLSPIPSDAKIDKATLRIYQGKIVGSPYAVGARVMVDHLDYGNTFENSDYSISSISSSFTQISDNNNIEWKEATVTDQVKDDLSNSRTYSQYRIHMAIESVGGTVSGDSAYFESADNSMGTGNIPELIIEYY